MVAESGNESVYRFCHKIKVGKILEAYLFRLTLGKEKFGWTEVCYDCLKLD